MKKFFLLFILFSIFIYSDTANYTFNFLSSSEGFTATTGGNSTAAFDSTTGNPAGSVYTEITGRNRTNSNYWEWTGTFENLGVLPGSIVTGIQLTSAYNRCTIYNTGLQSTAGPYELRDSTGNTVLATLWAGRNFSATDGNWVFVSGTNQTLSNLPSNTTIRIRLNNTLRTGNSNTAQVRLYDDQISLTITYSRVTRVQDGVNPLNQSICPDSASVYLDSFTLSTNSGTDTVTAITIDFSNGTEAGLGLVEITSDNGATVYGSAINPADPQTINLSTSISVNTTEIQYKIRITPKSHINMPSPPGANYNVTGVVSDITCTNNKSINDTSSSTIIIDNLSTSSPTFTSCNGSSTTQIDLSWTNPSDSDFSSVLLIRGPAGGICPSFAPQEGLSYSTGQQGSDYIIYTGNGTSFSDTGLQPNTTYCFEIWAKDNCGNWSSTPSSTTCSTQAGANNYVTTGTPSGIVQSCTQINISSPFADDANGNSTTTIEYNTSNSWPGTVACSNLSGPSPRLCISSGLQNNTPYWFRVTFTDPDGVQGTNPQVIGPFTTYDCKTNTGTASAVVNSCTEITISAPFTGDWNSNGSTSFEKQQNCTGSFISVCSNITGASPRICNATSLTEDADWCFRVTFQDADGVQGTNPQIIGPYHTPPCTANNTTIVQNDVYLESCRQLRAIGNFTGDGNLNGFLKVEYNTTNNWPGTIACNMVTGKSPRQCIISNLSPDTDYYVRFSYTDPDGVSGTNPEAKGPYHTPVCGSDQISPTITFLSPKKDGIIGGVERLKIQVYDASGISSVSVSINGGTYSPAILNSNYNCGTNCGVYEYDFDTTPLANGEATIIVKASDPSSNTSYLSQGVQIKNSSSKPKGSGFILRRSHGSQLCLDCHNIQTHSSQYTGTSYGSWSLDCFACHTSHDTKNIYLIKENLRTPSSGEKSVIFRVDDKTGGTNPQNSYIGAYDINGIPYDDGICEVCHTKTNHYRNDGSGGDHTHNQNTRCVSCHQHKKGFAASGCDGCHKAPPAVGKHLKHDEVASVPTSYTDTTLHSTDTQYGFPCAKCHSGTHTNDTHLGSISDPYQVEVLFDSSTDPKNPFGSFTQKYPDAVDQGNDLTKYWSWTQSVSGTDGTCSNLYCHSNALPIGGNVSYSNVQWNQTATLNCSSCHSTRASDDSSILTELSAKHGKHISYNGEANTYNFKCDECHFSTILDNPKDPWLLDSNDLKSKIFHVNGIKDVYFSSTATSSNNINQSSGTYGGFLCSNIYCHSQGTSSAPPFPAPNTNLQWNTGTSNCQSCHGGNALKTFIINTNAHSAHINQATYLGSNFMCFRCHQDTASSTSDDLLNNINFHVNGLRNVSFSNGGNYNNFQCTNTYCHSNGTEINDYVNPPNWNSGTALPNNCRTCHGTEAGSIAGEPRYANNPLSDDTRNSHYVQDHTSSSLSCVKCHSTTVNSSGNLISGGSHLDQTRNVSNSTFISSYNETTETCTTICHNSKNATWGNTLSCRDCHLSSGAGNQDVNNYTWDNIMEDGTGTIAQIDGDDWTLYGHGNSTGFANESGNSAPNFDFGGRDGCLYCHTKTVSHNNPNNPFRLANVGAGNTAQLKNGVCTICHGGSGYNPGAGLIDSLKDINYYHYGIDHGTTGTKGTGGQLCWDCHDPHGDYNYGANQRLAYMFQYEPVENHNDASGNTTEWGVPIQIASTPDFRRLRDGTDAWGWGDYVINNSGGVCQVCHDNTNHFLKTTNWATDSTHFPGNRCTESCHKHQNVTFAQNEAFKPAGGTCKGCHSTRTGSIPRARIIGGTAGTEGDDFIRPSRHVSNGTTNEIVTDFDCIVCHMEGDVTSTTGDIRTNSTYHGGDGGSTTVDLRNVDSHTSLAVAWPGKRLSTWSATTAQRDGMDNFCLNCHDSDTSSATANRGGSWDIAVNSTNSGLLTGGPVSRRMTPFNTQDNQLNAREGDAGLRAARQNMGVVNVRGQFNYQNLTGKNWASHHNLRQFTKRYNTRNTTYWPNAAWTTYVTKEGQNIQTAGETAGLHCSDCHLNEVNAHGTRNTFYMLSDSNGSDASFTNTGRTNSTDICSKCHAATTYGEGNTSTASRTAAHNQSGSRCDNIAGGDVDGFAKLGWTGGANNADNQLPCLGCHGGMAFGMIHGTNNTYNPWKSTTWTSKMYRFMGTGGSMRWYSPNGSGTGNDTTWEGTATVGCYTIGAADNFGTCTNHSSGRTGANSNRARPLEY
ncbi:MAG: CxxxxCH/CxxCH domain-containing protein [Thermoanaerobaculia bacterium]